MNAINPKAQIMNPPRIKHTMTKTTVVLNPPSLLSGSAVFVGPAVAVVVDCLFGVVVGGGCVVVVRTSVVVG
jgi:hypothetical protein